MATKYRTYDFDHKIDPIEIINENDSFIEYKSGQRHYKSGHRFQYHDTWSEAKTFLIERTEAEIEIHTRLLAAEKANLAKLQQLKK